MRRGLKFVSQPLGVIHKHLIDIVNLKRREHIILIRYSIFIAGQGHIAF